MANITLDTKLFGSLTFDPDEDFSLTCSPMLDGRRRNLDLDMDAGLVTGAGTDRVLAALDDMDRLYRTARAALLQRYNAYDPEVISYLEERVLVIDEEGNFPEVESPLSFLLERLVPVSIFLFYDDIDDTVLVVLRFCPGAGWDDKLLSVSLLGDDEPDVYRI